MVVTGGHAPIDRRSTVRRRARRSRARFCWPAWSARVRGDGDGSPCDPAITRSGCWRAGHRCAIVRSRGVARARPRSSPPFQLDVPADPSSAAFFAALAAAGGVRGGGPLELTDVALNPTRLGFFRVLRDMGADVAWDVHREECGEPVGTITVAPRGPQGVEVRGEQVPAMIDELPMLACLGALARGRHRDPRRERAAGQGKRPDRGRRAESARRRRGRRRAAGRPARARGGNDGSLGGAVRDARRPSARDGVWCSRRAVRERHPGRRSGLRRRSRIPDSGPTSNG